MHVQTQHVDAHQPPTRRRTPNRVLHRVLAVVVMTAAVALAGQSAASAAPGHHWRSNQPGAGTPAATPAPAPAPSSSSSNKDYALAQLGGNSTQFACLDQLWTAESNWNPNAQNPTSTAYGIPQFLDSTWATTGIAKTSNAHRQIDAGLIYIGNRYGTSCAAWSFWQAHRWY
jgi:hypothetical protein